MKFNSFVVSVWSVLALSSFSISAQAQDQGTVQFNSEDYEVQGEDEFNPFDVGVEQQLQEIDLDYLDSTGQSAIMRSLPQFFSNQCRRSECSVFIDVVKATQTATLYVNGVQQGSWAVSTGGKGHGTPNFDKNPNGRIFDGYSSNKFPGGDYNGLGNMPYAVFISGGFALHGTPKGNWKYLGRPASHGCIRMHPDNGKIFNRLVRQYGIDNTWITVR